MNGISFKYAGTVLPGIPEFTPFITTLVVMLFWLVLKFTTLGPDTQPVGINVNSLIGPLKNQAAHLCYSKCARGGGRLHPGQPRWFHQLLPRRGKYRDENYPGGGPGKQRPVRRKV